MKSTSNFFILLVHSIIDEQEDAQNIERKIQILELTHHHLDKHITQDAETDAIGDAVAEYHRNTNQGRDDDGDKQPINIDEQLPNRLPLHWITPSQKPIKLYHQLCTLLYLEQTITPCMDLKSSLLKLFAEYPIFRDYLIRLTFYLLLHENDKWRG